MKDKYLIFNNLLDQIESIGYLTIENAVAFSSFKKDLIGELKQSTGKNEEQIWNEIKHKQVKSDIILKLFREE